MPGLFADVLTVSNNPDTPAQYTSLQEAVNDAGNMDTILVSASPFGYGTITIEKNPVVIIGSGYNNPYGDYNSKMDYIYLKRKTISNSASGTVISGFDFYQLTIYGEYGSGNDSTTQKMTDIVVERCRFDIFSFQGSNTVYRNISIRNNVVDYYVYFYPWGNSFLRGVTVHNNLFNGSYISSYYDAATPTNSNDLSKVYIRNNVFVNRSTSYSFEGIYRAVIENNIFYESEPINCYQSTFNNNCTWFVSQATLPYGDNGGDGPSNINQDPDFVEYDGGVFEYTDDFSLSGGSPCIDASTTFTGGLEGQGHDIGLYGLPLPFDIGENPAIPQVTEITFPDNISSVKVGGTLNVSFKAKKQD
ncbi:MAG: hypothetical protein ISS19_01700 [Bacteroidales bacterium]|nr:hypothetical protein [Bacteroidales bacterium]